MPSSIHDIGFRCRPVRGGLYSWIGLGHDDGMSLLSKADVGLIAVRLIDSGGVPYPLGDQGRQQTPREGLGQPWARYGRTYVVAALAPTVKS
jgi:hypothetical protein